MPTVVTNPSWRRSKLQKIEVQLNSPDDNDGICAACRRQFLDNDICRVYKIQYIFSYAPKVSV